MVLVPSGPMTEADAIELPVIDGLTIIDPTKPEQAERLDELGLDKYAVVWMARVDLPGERMLREHAMGERASEVTETFIPDDEYKLIVSTLARQSPYLDTLVSAGRALSYCPISGEPVWSDESALVDLRHAIYGFEGSERFYLLVGRWHGRKCALYLPERQIFIRLNDVEWHPKLISAMIESIRQYERVCKKHGPLIDARRATEGEGFVVVVGVNANFGHYIWQEMAGLDLLLERGLGDRINKIVCSPYARFDLEDLFPELDPAKIRKVENPSEVAQAVLEESGTVLRPIAVQISEKVRQRVLRAAKLEVGPRRIKEIQTAARANRLIWINLRAHNKMWNDQVNGHVAVLHALQERFGDIGVVYDGWTDTEADRDAIDKALSPDIPRYDTIGCTLAESIIWATEIAAYVAVLGSGLVINSWIGNRPGVAHCNHGHLLQVPSWPAVAPESIAPVFLTKDQVKSGEELYCNYDFDWQVLLPPLLEVLEKR